MDRTATEKPAAEPTPTPNDANALTSVLASTLADDLGETDPSVKKGFKRLVKRLGESLCAEVLEATQAIEASGGIWSVPEKRRRTKGGVFLALLKEHSPKARAVIQQHLPGAPGDPTRASTYSGKPPPPEPFVWERRGELVQEALSHQGQAMTAKMTLIGRPGKIVQHKDFVVTSMECRSLPPLPKGLPVPKSPRMTYTVYIAAKQWRKVAELVKAPDDLLIVEGFCVPDAESGGVALMVLSATTKSLQRQKNELAKASRGEPPPPAGGDAS